MAEEEQEDPVMEAINRIEDGLFGTIKPINTKILREEPITEHLSVAIVDEHDWNPRNAHKVTTFVDGHELTTCRHAIIALDTEAKWEKQAKATNMDQIIAAIATPESDEWKILGDNGVDENTELMVHWSNIQAWVEHDYDPNLLQSYIAIPILRALCTKKPDGTHVDEKACKHFYALLEERWRLGNKSSREAMHLQFAHFLDDMFGGEIEYVIQYGVNNLTEEMLAQVIRNHWTFTGELLMRMAERKTFEWHLELCLFFIISLHPDAKLYMKEFIDKDKAAEACLFLVHGFPGIFTHRDLEYLNSCWRRAHKNIEMFLALIKSAGKDRAKRKADHEKWVLKQMQLFEQTVYPNPLERGQARVIRDAMDEDTRNQLCTGNRQDFPTYPGLPWETMPDNGLNPDDAISFIPVESITVDRNDSKPGQRLFFVLAMVRFKDNKIRKMTVNLTPGAPRKVKKEGLEALFE